jgi:hypothetical protein
MTFHFGCPSINRSWHSTPLFFFYPLGKGKRRRREKNVGKSNTELANTLYRLLGVSPLLAHKEKRRSCSSRTTTPPKEKKTKKKGGFCVSFWFLRACAWPFMLKRNKEK